MAAKAGWLERMSRYATEWTGTSLAFGLAAGVVLIWLVTGPIFDFSNTWQLVINTGTTIVTFLMVFLIQRSQNKDSLALHMKLNELVAALPWSSNRLISAEELTEQEVKLLREHYHRLVELAMRDGDLTHSHSIEEAEAGHARKKLARGRRKGSRKKGGRARPAESKPAEQNGKQPPDDTA
jgi:low affinity Fe/Cu permease